MSSIWTPSGEHPTGDDDPSPATAPPGTPEDGEPTQAELLQARQELAAIPVADLVANHAIGLWQLAVLHLTPDPGPDGRVVPPRLAEAQLAIDALGALVEDLGPRLEPHDETLREALTQLRLAYVEVSGSTTEPGLGDGDTTA